MAAAPACARVGEGVSHEWHEHGKGHEHRLVVVWLGLRQPIQLILQILQLGQTLQLSDFTPHHPELIFLLRLLLLPFPQLQLQRFLPQPLQVGFTFALRFLLDVNSKFIESGIRISGLVEDGVLVVEGNEVVLVMIEGSGMVDVVFAVGLGVLLVEHWHLEEWNQLYVRMHISD